jgi:hypothetical protein
MIQSVLLLLAPAQKVPVIPSTEPLACKAMATRPALEAINHWRHRAAAGLVVIANAAGLLLFLAGLGLVLRLAEVLLS